VVLGDGFSRQLAFLVIEFIKKMGLNLGIIRLPAYAAPARLN
jgi:hypothetical protein